jgi:hypothetical protein
MSAVEVHGEVAEPEAGRELVVPLSELQTKAATAQASRLS